MHAIDSVTLFFMEEAWKSGTNEVANSAFYKSMHGYLRHIIVTS